MAQKTFGTKYIWDKANEAINNLQERNQRWLQIKQQNAVQAFRDKWFSRLFRKNWTDEQIIEKMLAHNARCSTICCSDDYPTSVSTWNDEIFQLIKIRNLANV